jgi:DNA-binding CsgD family transcriptional regulator
VYECSDIPASSASLKHHIPQGHLVGASTSQHQPEPYWPAAESLASASMALMLDEVDYGLILLLADGRVAFMNHAARSELSQSDWLTIKGDVLTIAHSQNADALRLALYDARSKAKRSLITLGWGATLRSLAIVPLMPMKFPPTTLVVLGKSKTCEDLSIQCFAANFGLTLAEVAVLKMLCAGVSPADIAEYNGVAISTVRTQIHSIRAKTAAESIASLVRQITHLPPLVGALRRIGRGATDPGISCAYP